MKKSSLLLIPLAVLLGVASWPAYTKVRARSLNQALCLAASQEDADAVQRLLARGARPSAMGAVDYENCGNGTQDCKCTTLPLHALSLAVDTPTTKWMDQNDPASVAHYDEALDTVSVLLQAGADVDARDENGLTALMLAHSPRMVNLLLAHGAKVDLRTKDGSTTLMFDAISFRTGQLKALLTAGADVNARDNDGKTAFMCAVDSLADVPDEAAVKALLAAGADVNARDRQGKTALRYALDENETDEIPFLKKIGARL